MTNDPLTPDEAALVIGVPAHQLRLWAWERARGPDGKAVQVGPRHVGTRLKPLYHEQDLREWVAKRAAAAEHSGFAGGPPGAVV